MKHIQNLRLNGNGAEAFQPRLAETHIDKTVAKNALKKTLATVKSTDR